MKDAAANSSSQMTNSTILLQKSLMQKAVSTQ